MLAAQCNANGFGDGAEVERLAFDWVPDIVCGLKAAKKETYSI